MPAKKWEYNFQILFLLKPVENYRFLPHLLEPQKKFQILVFKIQFFLFFLRTQWKMMFYQQKKKKRLTRCLRGLWPWEAYASEKPLIWNWNLENRKATNFVFEKLEFWKVFLCENRENFVTFRFLFFNCRICKCNVMVFVGKLIINN